MVASVHMVLPQDAHAKLTMVNGAFTDCVSVDDRGVAYGDGLFESMLYVEGEIPLLKWHLDRLLAGSIRLGLFADEQKIRDDLSVFLARVTSTGYQCGKIKLIITRGQGGRACYPTTHDTLSLRLSSILLQIEELSSAHTSPAVGLVSAQQPLISPPVLVGLKHLSRLPYILPALGVNLRSDQELMFLDEDGYVVETMHHNLFFLVQKTLVTPALNKAGVAGVARAILTQEIADSQGFDVALKNIRYADIAHYDACFIANAVRGLSPVVSIDEYAFAIPETFYRFARAFAKKVVVQK